MKALIILCVLGLILIVGSCNDTGTVTSPAPSGQNAGQMLLRFANPPTDITTVIATLTRQGFPTRTLHLAISDSSASGSFNDVEVGTWHLRVDALDSTESVRFTGETDVEVRGGVISQVSLQLMPTAGSIQITVTWGGAPQDPSLLLYLPFNGNANDESGHGHNGQVVGATLAPDRNGMPNRAYSFDGNYNHIEIPSFLSDTVSGFTASAWVYTNDPTTNRIFLYTGSDRGESEFEIRNSSFSFAVDITNVGWFQTFSPSVGDQFVHLVGVYKRGNWVQLWVNGVLTSQVAVPMGTLRHGDATHTSSVGSFAPQWIDWQRQHGIYSWHGTIDQVRIYARALNQAEILALYQSGQ